MQALATFDIQQRARNLFEAHRERIVRRTDRLFASLMIVQYLAGILAGLILSPRTWSGTQSSIHPHILAAAVLGGVIVAGPLAMIRSCPGAEMTRYVVACAQMLMSALLIHISGGRIETHFHIFGSLALLAFYRDWRVFIPATLVVGLDHLLRGLYWPESVYGIMTASPWRSLEHAGWVVFEEVFLIQSCCQGVREMREIAEQRAKLEGTKSAVELEVQQRTQELVEQTAALQAEMAERRRAEAQRESMHQQLLETSRRVGMAEVAAGVLHNVGNVLNSVNVSASLAADKVRKSETASLAPIAQILSDHESDLAEFISADQKGRLIPQYLTQLSHHLENEQRAIMSELELLLKNIEHVKGIVNMQQAYGRVMGLTEQVSIEKLIDDALLINMTALERHGITLIRNECSLVQVWIDKQHVLEILVNLICNAKQAMTQSRASPRVLSIHVEHDQGPRPAIRIQVSDNGIGIPPENLHRIFAHGFTTRKDGHGFGLHNAALAAKAMGGSLKVHSEGWERGATFTLELPLQSQQVVTA